jgi:hypothetical protein
MARPRPAEIGHDEQVALDRLQAWIRLLAQGVDLLDETCIITGASHVEGEVAIIDLGIVVDFQTQFDMLSERDARFRTNLRQESGKPGVRLEIGSDPAGMGHGDLTRREAFADSRRSRWAAAVAEHRDLALSWFHDHLREASASADSL